MRGIINSKNSPTDLLEIWFYKKLKRIIGESDLNVKNSLEMYSQIEGLRIPEGYDVYNFDVSNMYPSIPTIEVIDLVITKNENLPINEKIDPTILRRLLNIFLFEIE